MNKKKIYKWCNKYINASNLKMTILLIPLAILLIRGIQEGEYKLSSFLDVSILVSFLLIFVCEVLANIISSVITAKCEDAVKLTEDYGRLNRKYSRENLIRYNGETFPEICLAFRKEKEPPFRLNLEVDTKYPVYELPKQIADHSKELMEAHSHSIIYNNTNVRLNDCQQNGSEVELRYGKTTYFDSLITNRAMDYPIAGKSIREIYEPGPFLSSLAESKMSNHLGFNGFVELAEGKIIFVHRTANVSIGKNTLATSIGASYKAVYGLDEKRRITRKTMANAIRMEIKDELKINIPEEIPLEESIFAFYRDIVEGGKPQFLFYVKLPYLTDVAFEEEFIKQMKDKGQKTQDHRKVVTDGTHFKYFTLEQLKEFSYQPDGMKDSDGIMYKMMPSSVVSVVLLLKYKA